ncbi:MAG: Fe-S cluster assembly protein SufD [Bauldia sp.]
MSAEPRILKTEAEQQLAEQYRALRDGLPGPAAATLRRDTAIASFEKAGLPHRRVEAWKYTDLRALMRKALPVAPQPSAEAAAAALGANDVLKAVDRYRLVIADGFFQEALSDRAALLAEGVEVATLTEFLGFDNSHVLGILDAPHGSGDDAMIALNTALASDGVVVLVPPDRTISKPIEIVHLAATPETAAATRSAVRIGANAKLTLYVTRAGAGAHHGNHLVGIAAAEGARVKMVDVQAGGAESEDIMTFSARAAAGAEFDHLAVVTGARISRLQGFVMIEGEGARFGAHGANMLRGKAHGDIALVIEHAAAHATSRVLYKNVADGEAMGAFQGRIVVQPGAQKTDGKMLTNSLLLSDTAEFAAKPELEIYADDVQCGHGATTGQFDETMLFYLLSRGIPRPEAEAMLLQSFLAAAVEAMGDEGVTAAIEPIVAAWLGGRGIS